MALVPEHILQAVIIRGINAMRRDSRLVEQLFRNVDRAGQAQMQELFKSQVPFDLCLNYPREVLKVPGIVIVLRAQDEAQAFLGNSMGTGLVEEFAYDGGLEGEILGGVASATALSSAEPPLLFGPCRVTSATSTVITVSGVVITDRWRNAVCRIVAGTGAGQSRVVSGNTNLTVTVTPGWRTAPDDTSIFEVRGVPTPVLGGEPARMYDRRDLGLWTENIGVYDALQYQVQIVSANSAMTIYLTMIVRAILLLATNMLEQQGIINLKVSATDLVPRAEYMPDVSYVRALNLSFTCPFTAIRELCDLATSLQLSLDPASVSGDGASGAMVSEVDVGLTTETVEG